MRRAPWELWIVILGIIFLVIVPALVGIALFKLYRYFYPHEQAKDTDLAKLEESDDSFYKRYLIGWLVCGPIFYLVYQSFTT